MQWQLFKNKSKCSDFPPSFVTLSKCHHYLSSSFVFPAACLYCFQFLGALLTSHCSLAAIVAALKWEVLVEIWLLLCLRQLVLFLSCVSWEAERLEEKQIQLACPFFICLVRVLSLLSWFQPRQLLTHSPTSETGERIEG